jgi:hypothetical protein
MNPNKAISKQEIILLPEKLQIQARSLKSHQPDRKFRILSHRQQCLVRHSIKIGFRYTMLSHGLKKIDSTF